MVRHLGQRCTILPSRMWGFVIVLSLGHLILFALALPFGEFFGICLVPTTTGLPLDAIVSSKLLGTLAFSGGLLGFLLYFRWRWEFIE